MDVSKIEVGEFYIYYGKNKEKFLIEVLEVSHFKGEILVYEHIENRYVTASVNDFIDCAIANKAEKILYGKQYTPEEHVIKYKASQGPEVQWKRQGNQLTMKGTFTQPGVASAGGSGGAGNGVYMVMGVGGGGGGGSGGNAGGGVPSKGGQGTNGGGSSLVKLSMSPGDKVLVKI